MNAKYIFSLKLCGFLCMNGIPVKGVRPNAKVKNKDVYVFEESERLEELILEYQKKYCTKEKSNDYFKNSSNACK